MHPSSFYDLRARYIYTPLYGPYSLSEALDGLIFYSLDKPRDSISIGSKTSLRHELVSELSNVIDDLQDYLVYFSSKFIISPLNSPDLLKDLQVSHNDFKYLIVCWGAVITHLVIARDIVEHNFWPHLFQPTIDKLAAFQKFKHPLSFVLPNPLWNKSFSSSSAFNPSPQTDNTPHATGSPLESSLPFNVQSERPQRTPSETDPTGGEEGHVSSLRLDTTPTSSRSPTSRIPLNHRPSNVVLNLHVYEACSDEAFPPPNRASVAQSLCGSNSACTGITKGLGSLEDNAKVVGSNEQVTKGKEAVAEGEEVTQVPSTYLPPVQLTTILGKPAIGLATVSTRIPSSLTASRPSSTSPWPLTTASQPKTIT